MDESGNILLKRLGKSPVYVKVPNLKKEKKHINVIKFKKSRISSNIVLFIITNVKVVPYQGKSPSPSKKDSIDN